MGKKWKSRPKPSKTDHVWGIERGKGAENAGELVLPYLNLWRIPSPVPVDYNLVGILPHDTLVTVKGRKRMRGRTWYLVEGQRRNDDVPENMREFILEPDKPEMIRPQTGWILESLLKVRGEEYWRAA